jgi:hypothetical protein
MSEERIAGNGAKDTFAADIESLKHSFGQLRSDLTGLINNALGAGKSGSGVLREQVGSAAGELKEKIVGLKDKGAHSAEALEEKFSDHPLATALIAFGAGFIIAKILTRK